MLHGEPAQQSAVVVHAPPDGTHAVALQTNAGWPPAGFGTHGAPQQSALVAHAVPAGGAPLLQSTSLAAVQRGIPSESCLQFSGCVWTVPAQHSSVALHELVARRQMAPAGAQALPCAQRPSVAPGSLLQCTSVVFPPPPDFVDPGAPGAPQQSLSVWQSSPVGWHPLGGWQTYAPVGAYGRHERLQQSPPHSGRPEPLAGAVQAWPAGVHPPAPGAVTIPHVPRVAPAALVHAPPQQSRSAEQVSPFCPQNDGAAQTPLVHSLPQHSAALAHVLPSVLHVAFRGAHAPFVHLPPQHSPSAAHLPLSAVHCLPEHFPLTHDSVQHWRFVLHAASAPPQALVPLAPTTGGVHGVFVGSQEPLVVLEPSGPPSVVGAAGALSSLPHPAEEAR